MRTWVKGRGEKNAKRESLVCDFRSRNEMSGKPYQDRKPGRRMAFREREACVQLWTDLGSLGSLLLLPAAFGSLLLFSSLSCLSVCHGPSRRSGPKSRSSSIPSRLSSLLPPSALSAHSPSEPAPLGSTAQVGMVLLAKPSESCSVLGFPFSKIVPLLSLA